MTLRQSLVCVCLCLVTVAASATDQTVTVTSTNNTCTVDYKSVSISHDKSKKDRVFWKSGDQKAYLVSFQYGLSPCHAKKTDIGTQRVTFSVPPGDVSDGCFAQPKTDEANYKYFIYNLDGSGNWQQCADPIVVVSDGGGGGGVPLGEKKRSKK